MSPRAGKPGLLVSAAVLLLHCTVSEAQEKHTTTRDALSLGAANVHQIDDGNTSANCYNVESSNATFTACLPEIIVAGHYKCGTSALYTLLTMHPDVVGTPEKEYCMTHEQKAVEYLANLPQATASKTLVAGCIKPELNEKMFHVLHPKRPIKLLYIVRDYADTMWASFNYWCLPDFDVDCVIGGWTNAETTYRSPELFHEFLLAENKTGVMRTPQESPFLNRFVFTSKIEAYEKIVGRANILVLDADSLEHNARSTWHKIATFTGLSAHHPSLRLFLSRRYNTQDQFEYRGVNSSKPLANHVAGLYPASGYRPMLNRTRQMINEAWLADCTRLNEVYNLTMRACM